MILEVRELVRDYVLPRRHPFAPLRTRRVLHGVSLSIPAGGALGLVGESGSGKSTLARCVLGLDRPSSGQVLFEGEDISARPARGRLQAVFQDPNGSLDPRMRVGHIVAEPLLTARPRVGRAERMRRVQEMLDSVGLPIAAADRYPHEFSGGQRQRIAIARALVTRPALVVADEPVSALDVSIQAQVLQLIRQLRGAQNTAWLFISHDLTVVRSITDNIAVMEHGRIVETGPASDVLQNPQHPHTQALVAAIPRFPAPVAAIDASNLGERHATGTS